jgi:hypothetical protein
MKTEKLSLSLAYRRESDHKLEEIASEVIANLYTHPAYSAPPVTKEALEAALDMFQQAMAAQAQGGTAATAEKRNRRDELVKLLDLLALYVQAACNYNEAVLLGSGFKVKQTSRAQSELPTPEGIRIRNGISGQALVSVDPIQNARCYEVTYALLDEHEAVGPWQVGGIHTSSRNMRLSGLLPGRVYVFKLRAIGGSTGYSDWSAPTHHRVG